MLGRGESLIIENKMNIALIGYGKMGHLIEQVALERGHKIVCIIDVDNPQDFGSAAFHSADVAIEFTRPEAAFDNIRKAWAEGVKVVTGSTGWQQEHRCEVECACNEQGKTLFWSSNFSLGIYLFNQVNQYLARLMNGYPAYDVQLEEVHHIHKLDAPSGTAITLAEGILQNIDRKQEWVKGTLTTPDGVQPGQPAQPSQLVIDSVRRDEVPGIHAVTYTSQADTITITHDAHNRSGFALGAVLAAEYTLTHQGLLTMDDLFK